MTPPAASPVDSTATPAAPAGEAAGGVPAEPSNPTPAGVGPARASGTALRHSSVDDIQAGATAIILVSLGLSFLNSAGLMTGGTPGIAFLLSYSVGLPLGVALFLVNLPFYLLGWRGMGPRFTLKTLAAVAGLSLGVEVVRRLVVVQADIGYAAVAGGVLVGAGLLVMFRHQASFGGVNILALYLQRRWGWPAGKVQMAIDLAILMAAFGVMDLRRVGWSVVGALAVNAVLIWNHRPGRYFTLSR
ncbi:YitT family protein [Ideonella sp. DXS29W]|uniref:YitT family protein n=1 Tax=Ideonella lacteola TaxID=2984193 RepID=A0ABU9BNF7_9BURK